MVSCEDPNVRLPLKNKIRSKDLLNNMRRVNGRKPLEESFGEIGGGGGVLDKNQAITKEGPA